MGFRTGSYATIWSVEENGRVAKVQMSTSKKNRTTDQYETDFSGFVNFIGKARDDALHLSKRDRIKIGDCEVTNKYVKDKNTTYTNYAIFSFEKVDSQNKTQKTEEPFDDSSPF